MNEWFFTMTIQTTVALSWIFSGFAVCSIALRVELFCIIINQRFASGLNEVT